MSQADKTKSFTIIWKCVPFFSSHSVISCFQSLLIGEKPSIVIHIFPGFSLVSSDTFLHNPVQASKTYFANSLGHLQTIKVVPLDKLKARQFIFSKWEKSAKIVKSYTRNQYYVFPIKFRCLAASFFSAISNFIKIFM